MEDPTSKGITNTQHEYEDRTHVTGVTSGECVYAAPVQPEPELPALRNQTTGSSRFQEIDILTFPSLSLGFAARRSPATLAEITEIADNLLALSCNLETVGMDSVVIDQRVPRELLLLTERYLLTTDALVLLSAVNMKCENSEISKLVESVVRQRDLIMKEIESLVAGVTHICPHVALLHSYCKLLTRDMLTSRALIDFAESLTVHFTVVENKLHSAILARMLTYCITSLNSVISNKNDGTHEDIFRSLDITQPIIELYLNHTDCRDKEDVIIVAESNIVSFVDRIKMGIIWPNPSSSTITFIRDAVGILVKYIDKSRIDNKDICCVICGNLLLAACLLEDAAEPACESDRKLSSLFQACISKQIAPHAIRILQSRMVITESQFTAVLTVLITVITTHLYPDKDHKPSPSHVASLKGNVESFTYEIGRWISDFPVAERGIVSFCFVATEFDKFIEIASKQLKLPQVAGRISFTEMITGIVTNHAYNLKAILSSDNVEEMHEKSKIVMAAK